MIQKNVMPLSSGQRGSQVSSNNKHLVFHLLLTDILGSLLFCPEYGGSTFFRNVGELIMQYAATHPKRQYARLCLYYETRTNRLMLFTKIIFILRITHKYSHTVD